ncbi:hypothetical protein F5148DRAFT_990007, partial [Russula earlei]
LQDNANSTVLWEIHRPLHRWYIHLRSPHFPPNIFVSLVPVPASSLNYCPGSLKFSCCTNTITESWACTSATLSSHLASHSATDSDMMLTDTSSRQFSLTHTYPPVPTLPSAVILPLSLSTVHAKLDQLAQCCLAILHFILSPCTHATTTPVSKGLFLDWIRILSISGKSTSTSIHTLFPTLTQLEFKGIHEYLEDLVAQIEAPLLSRLYITFSMDLNFILPQLHQVDQSSRIVQFM